MQLKYLLVIFTLIIALSIGQAQAQDNRTAISITVPQFSKSIYEDLIQQFEAENPDIRVHLIPVDEFQEPLDLSDQKYFEKAQALVSQADVLLLTSDDISLELTRAGFLLDLNPIIGSDPTLNVQDFPTKVWEGFQWDGGFWALPVGVNTYLLKYDPATFDQLGLPYPDENWTLADFENAMRSLLQIDANNQITRAGLTVYRNTDEQALLGSLLSGSLVDINSIPLQPQLTSHTELASLISTWSQLKQARLTESSATFEDGPLTILDTKYGLFFSDNPNSSFAFAPFPNYHAPLHLRGFAISGGTQHPDAAYRLISFLSQQAGVASSGFDTLPARQSQWGGDTSYSPEAMALIQTTINNGQTPAQNHFRTAITKILSEVANNVPVQTAIENAQQAILSRLTQAEQHKQSTTITIVPIPEAVTLQTGEVQLRFGVWTFETQLPNQDAWDRALGEFVNGEPGIGDVALDTTTAFDVQELTERYDCFYTPFNLVQESNLARLRSIDPLMASDASVNPSDFLPGVLVRVQRNNQTWALPIDISPDVITFDRDALQTANLPDPDPAWTTGDFETYLRTLQQADPESGKLSFFTGDNSGLLTLIGAYGGQPIDYGSNPPVIQFTDPATVQAIQQVLDLVRSGLIAYGNDENGFTLTTLAVDSLSNARFFLTESGDFNIGIVPFPRGGQQSAVAYSVGAAYISADSPHVDACYRLISSISANPELVTDMPARSSVLNNPQMSLVQDPGLVQMYQTIAETLQQPDVLIFQSQGGFDIGGLFDFIWLDKAFKSYIQNGGDLNQLLTDAGQLTQEFFSCKQGIDFSAGITEDNADQLFDQLRDCATRIDPSVANLFSDQ